MSFSSEKNNIRLLFFCIFEELFIYIFKHTSQKILDKATLKNEIHEPLKNNGLKYILID